MADFNQSLKLLLLDEGGYADVPGDAGGETYCGIARRFQPTWPGWRLIDAHKVDGTCNDADLKRDSALQAGVADFYRATFWRFDACAQPVADKLMSLMVLHGPQGGARIVQQGLVRLGYRVEVDGDLGPATMALVGKVDADDMLHGIRAYASLAHAEDVIRSPSQAKFLDGWLWRATA